MEQRTWARAEHPDKEDLHLHFVFKEQTLFRIIPSFMTPKVLTPDGNLTSQSQNFWPLFYWSGLVKYQTRCSKVSV